MSSLLPAKKLQQDRLLLVVVIVSASYFCFYPDQVSYHDVARKVSVKATNNSSASRFEIRKSQARKALARLEEEGVLDTEFSSSASVRENGFPGNWNSCTLESVFKRLEQDADLQGQSKVNPLQIVVLGGSASARSPNNCSKPGNLVAGRYSNLLQDSLDRLSAIREEDGKNIMEFEVINMAQGSTDSVWNSIFLDELVDTERASVLIWEFSLNDGRPTNRDEIDQKLDLWLRRVQGLFSEANRPVPPIILLYFWDYRIGSNTKKILKDGVGETVL
jgi:hypothetical protein